MAVEGRKNWRLFIYRPVKNGTNARRREKKHSYETTSDTIIRQKLLRLLSTDLL
jgi:hypothetical protein